MIKEIRQAIKDGTYEYSLHAVDQSILRHILRREIEEAIEEGEEKNELRSLWWKSE